MCAWSIQHHVCHYSKRPVYWVPGLTAALFSRTDFFVQDLERPEMLDTLGLRLESRRREKFLTMAIFAVDTR